jgi:hypothetical protein
MEVFVAKDWSSTRLGSFLRAQTTNRSASSLACTGIRLGSQRCSTTLRRMSASESSSSAKGWKPASLKSNYLHQSINQSINLCARCDGFIISQCIELILTTYKTKVIKPRPQTSVCGLANCSTRWSFGDGFCCCEPPAPLPPFLPILAIKISGAVHSASSWPSPANPSREPRSRARPKSTS